MDSTFFSLPKAVCDKLLPRYNSLLSFSIQNTSAPTIILFPSTETEPVAIQSEYENGFINQQLNSVIIAKENKTVEEYLTNAIKHFDKTIQTVREQGVDGPLFVMGSCLGAIAAISVMRERSDLLKGIIIESALGNISEWIKINGIQEEYQQIPSSHEQQTEWLRHITAEMEQIKKPTLIFHGAIDKITSVASAEKLQAASAARTKNFFVIPGASYAGEASLAHFGGEQYFTAIRNFINTICGINTWRQRRIKQRDINK